MFYYVSEQPDYTIAFVGMSGTGKSTAGNFFFQEEVFWSVDGLISGTDKCSAATSTICGETVTIIDTPGFFDGHTSAEVNFEELSKALTLSKNGIHAVVFVMSSHRYLELYQNTIQQLLRFKGLEPFLFVLITHAKKIGVNKEAAHEYIQQVLLNPHCPEGFKDLMQLVENRVVMLESTNAAESYQAQKSKEFITMIENIHKSNAYKIYTNSMLQHAAQIYEKAKLQQQLEIRITTQFLQSYEEKIRHEEQANDTATEGVVLQIDKKMLENKLEEIKDEQYLEKLANKILQDEMEKNSTIGKSVSRYMYHHAQRSDYLKIFLPHQTLSLGALGGLLGGSVIGLSIGSLFGLPGAGAEIGAVLGAAVGDAYGPASKAYDDCKQQ